MNANQLREYASSPMEFVESLLRLTPYQRNLLTHLQPSLLSLKKKQVPDLRRYWCEWSKGAGKDTTLAAVTLWLLCFCPWPLFGQVGACDEAQADELRKALIGLIDSQPWIGELITPKATKIINKRTGASVEILSADDRGSHGARPDWLVINELTHQRTPEFASNLADNAAKVDRSVVAIATNAGSLTHWSHKWREIAVASPRWHTSIHAQPAPWISKDELAEAELRNPHSRFRRLFWGEWSSGDGDAFPEDLIKSALTLDAPRPRRQGMSYVGGLDLGITRDSTAFVVIGKNVGWMETVYPDQPREPRHIRAMRDLGYLPWRDPNATEEVWHGGDGRLEVAMIWVWRPTRGRKVQLDDVEAAIVQANERFRLEGIIADAWQMEHMSQRLTGNGINCVATSMTGPTLTQMANTTLGVFQDKRIDLFPDDTLLADLRAVQVVEKSYGVRLESPRNSRGHGDTVSALQLAIINEKYLGAAARCQNLKLVLSP